MKSLNLLTIVTIVLLITGFGSCKPKPQPCCIDFNGSSSFPPGTAYNNYNDSVYYSCGFTVRTDRFFINGQSFYTSGIIKPATATFGVGQVFNTNNITLKFTNIITPKPVTITFDYLDMGGTENLSINGNLYSGELSAAPATLSGASVTVTSTPIALPAKGNKGRVTLSGTIKNFNVGGQEFYLDNICFK